MNDRYVPPPPPYELRLSVQHKVGEGLQAIEAPKICPFQDGEASKEQMDYKDSKAFDQKAFPEVAVYPLRIHKRSAKPDDPSPRPHRPLPPRPVDAHRLDLQGPEQGSKLKYIIESKEALSQQDRVAELHIPPPPPFSATARSSEDPFYLQSIPHSSKSYPSNTTPRPPHNQPHQRYNNTPPPSPYYPERPQVEASYRGRFQSGPRNSSQPRNFGMHLAFDPSVAYSGSQADAWGSEPPRGAYAASLYSSAVSSHLHPGAPPGSRQSYVPTSHVDRADMRSLQSRYSVVVDPMASTASFSYGPGPKVINDHDQRWATSESDIHQEVYHGRP